MAYSPSEKYPGAVDVDPDYQGGKFRDNNPSTTNNGSPLKAIDRNELLARDEAIMNDAGFEYNGLPDTPQDSQLFKAYKASLGNGANLLSNHNFLIQTPDDSQPLPSATPTSYPPGYQIFSDVFANETTGITNLTYIDGRVSFSGGDLYFAVPNTGGLERLDTDQFVASVADFDGKPRTRGVSFALVGDEYRVTVGIDALEDESANETLLGSVKFEQGKVATGHNVSKTINDVYGTFLTNVAANPKDYGVKYGLGFSQSQREENSGKINEMIQSGVLDVRITGDCEIYDPLVVASGMRVAGITKQVGSLRGFHPSKATIEDDTLDKPDSQNNNSRNVVIEHLKIQSENSHCINATTYQWRLERNRLTCPNGAGVKHHTGGYCVESEYISNEFNDCGNGIDGNDSGFRSPTDMYLKDNIFNAAGKLDHAVKLRNSSGTKLDGNHYYQGAAKEFVLFNGGINVRNISEYYESMGNARVSVVGGNPSSIGFIGCDIWGGTGGGVDWNGDAEHLIKMSFSAFNNGRFTFSANKFLAGSNNVPIFGLTNGNYDAIGGVQVSFDKSNVLGGVYKLSELLANGSAQTANMIQSDHVEFIHRNTTEETPLIAKGGFSEYWYEYSSGGLVRVISLPTNSTAWCANKPLRFVNYAEDTTVQFSAGSININFLGAADATIRPYDKCTIMQDPSDPSSYLIVKG